MKSPLEVSTKAGKLIVSAVDDMKKEPPTALTQTTPSQLASVPPQQKSIELTTKKGTIFVHATTKNDQLESVVIERQKNRLTDAKATPESIAKQAINVSAKSDTQSASSTATKPPQKEKRERVDFSRSSLERNFITPARAISDFLLKMSDLESLPKTKRRSPYEQEPPIIVYWRKDVEAKAIEVWGSRENLLRECLKREIERKRHQQSRFDVL